MARQNLLQRRWCAAECAMQNLFQYLKSASSKMPPDDYHPRLIAFITCPKEAAIVGRIVAGYGELEYAMSLCLGTAIGDEDAAYKCFFRTRGEEQRIEIADALMRHVFSKHELIGEYGETIGAVRWCRKLRNQYAHAHWMGYQGTWPLFHEFGRGCKSTRRRNHYEDEERRRRAFNSAREILLLHSTVD